MKSKFTILFTLFVALSATFAQGDKKTTTLKNLADSLWYKTVPIPTWLNRSYEQMGKLVVQKKVGYGYGTGNLEYDKALASFSLPDVAITLVIDPLRAAQQEVEDEIPDILQPVVDQYLTLDEWINEIEATLQEFRFGFQGVAKRKVTKFYFNESTTWRYNSSKWRWAGIGIGFQSPRVGTQSPYLDVDNFGKYFSVKGIGEMSIQNTARTDRGAKAITLFVTAALHELPFLKDASTLYSWKNKHEKDRYIRWTCDLYLGRGHDGSVNVSTEIFLGEDLTIPLIEKGVPPLVAQSIVNYLRGDGLPSVKDALEETTMNVSAANGSIFIGGETGGLTLGVDGQHLWNKGVKLNHLGFQLGYTKSLPFFQKKNKD